MSSLPWETDRALDAETVRSVIANAFPDIDVSRIDHLGSGWEFDAFATGDGWVFRFPRRAEYQEAFAREAPVVALVRSALHRDIGLPTVERIGAPSVAFPYAFAGHRYIEGAPADAISSHHLPEMARSIGAALGAIHSVPIAAARAAGVAEPPPPNQGAMEWFRRNLAGATQLAGSDATVDLAVRWVSELENPLQSLDAPRRFIHYDLSPEHLLVDPETGRLAGILDWTSTIIGDGARDFVTAATFGGWNFVEQVLANYPHSVDEGFRERLQFMARFLSVMWLGEARWRGADIAKHVSWVRNAFASPRASPTSG